MKNSGDIQASGFTFDAGLVLRLGNKINLGVTGYNLTNTKTIYAPIILGTGLSLSSKGMLFIETDIDIDFTSYNSVAYIWKIGTELLLKQLYAFRFGYAHDFYNKIDRISCGLGFVFTRFAIDLGYKQDIQYKNRFRLALGLKIFIS